MARVTFSPTTLLPLIGQLGQYVSQAVQRYGDLRAAGLSADADVLAVWLELQVASWHPKAGGVALLADPETRRAGCRFLAGIAHAIASGVQ